MPGAIEAMSNDSTNAVGTVEYFARRKIRAKGMEPEGLSTRTYELKDDFELQNIMSSRGFVWACQLAILVKEHLGFNWLAVVCNSWVWLCRGSTNRSEWQPERPKNPSAKVEHGSVMVSRYVALRRLFASRRIESCLENPGGSPMPKHHRMVETIDILGLEPTKICMGTFCGRSKKYMLLWSQSSWTTQLHTNYDPQRQSGNLVCPLSKSRLLVK